MSYEPMQCWAFAWDIKPKPFITWITSYSRTGLIDTVEAYMGEPWARTYRRGGRAVKVTIQERTHD